ncbi:MAG: response regulator [bacterium]|nr:response regulator [bacterium]
MHHTIDKALNSIQLKKQIVFLNKSLLEVNEKLKLANESLEEKVQERTRELTLSKEKYRRIIEDSFDPIIILNKKADIIGWNKGAELTFGYKEQEITGKPFSVFIPQDQELLKNSLWYEKDEKGFVKNFIMKTIALNNESIFVNITASKLEDECISIILRDITKEKQIELMKSDFVSNVSHELRTPLTSIKGAVELLLKGSEGPLTDSQIKFLTIVKNNTMRLIKLISDLLDLSKIESSGISMDLKPNNIMEIIKSVIEEILPLANKKEITVDVPVQGTLTDIYCDSDKIKQVLINLIGNAIKFTPAKGTILMTVEELSGDLQVNIKDNGVGIEEKYHDIIFEKFRQIDSSSTRTAEGTGLGLAIVKSIIEAHHGKIWINSKKDKGSTFSFTLPKIKEKEVFKIIESAGKKPVKSVPLADFTGNKTYTIKKILIVDDDEDIVQVIKGHLEKEGYEGITAHSGLDAVKKAIEFKPQLITLDILMPGMDGFTLLELLKQNPITKDIPVVIISVIFEKEKGYKLGVSDYITKPFELDRLLDSIKKIEIEIQTSMQKKKILIIDDDPDIIANLTVALNEMNYIVLNAYDALQGLALAKKEKPDIMLLDLSLPQVDGFMTIKQFKDDHETNHIPIIAMSEEKIENSSRVIKLGVKEYLIKPFTVRALLEELDKILKE